MCSSDLGASPVLIGLVPALPLAGGLLPQALLVGWVARHGRKLPLYRRASAFRFAGLLLLVFGAFFLGAWPGLLLGVFLAGLFLFALFTAVASLPYWEVLAKACSISGASRPIKITARANCATPEAKGEKS